MQISFYFFAGAIIFATGFFIGRRYVLNQEGKSELLPLDFESNLLEAVRSSDMPECEKKQWINWLNYDGSKQYEEV